MREVLLNQVYSLYTLAEKAFWNDLGDQKVERIHPDVQLDIIEMGDSRLHYYASCCRVALPKPLQFNNIEELDDLMDLFFNREHLTNHDLSPLEVFNDQLIISLPAGFQYDLPSDICTEFYWMVLLMMQIREERNIRGAGAQAKKNETVRRKLDPEGQKKYDHFLNTLNI